MVVEHVLGQAHQRAVDVVDLGRPLLEHGVAEHPDGVGRHGVKGSVGRGGWHDPRAVLRRRARGGRPAGARCALTLPDLDRGADRPTAACSAATGSTPAPAACCWRRRRRRRTGDLLDLGCGYGPDRRHPGPPRARGHGLGRRRQRAGGGPVRRRTPRRLGSTNVRALVAADPGRGRRRAARRRPLRRHLVEPAHPHRQGRPARAAAPAGWPGSPRTAAPTWWCRSTSAPTRWPRG